jgi:hypothetical protein
MRLVIAIALVAGCTETERPTSWSYVHATLIVPNCATASCHSREAAVAGLAFDDPDEAYDALIERRYVVPGDATSPLLQLLRADERPRMPPDAPLPRADVDLVEAWIVRGAQR